MAVRNTLLGGSDWTTEVLASADLNDTFDETIFHDAFTLIDDTSLSHTGTTETLKRTYTINKAVDGLIWTTSLRHDTAGAQGEITLYKNGTQIAVGNIFPISSSYDAASIQCRWSFTTNYITMVGNSGTIRLSISLYINESFSATDTFEIKMRTNNAASTVVSEKRLLQGVKNKTTDTTWVSTS